MIIINNAEVIYLRTPWPWAHAPRENNLQFRIKMSTRNSFAKKYIKVRIINLGNNIN